jgi:ubiquinone/menaquinone biosynthesis C-methylase UbiE
MSYFDHFSSSNRTSIGEWIVKQVKKQEYEALHPFITESSKILEIGPGWGEMQEILFSNGFRNYYAIEPNPAMCNELLRKGIVVRSYLIPELKEEDQSFDVVFLSDVFEHLNGSSDGQVFMQHCRRILKNNGIICIASPDYLHWKDDLFLSDYTHSNITSVRRTIQLFQDNGIQTIKTIYLSGFITGKSATLLSRLVRLVSVFVQRDRIDNKPYKLTTSFLRRFLIIGKKHEVS